MKPFENAKVVAVGVDPTEYGAEQCERGEAGYTVRSHTLTEIMRNPRRWVMGYESPGSASMLWGDLFDCMLLTPAKMDRFVVKPESYPAPKDHAKVKSGAIEAGSPLPWNGNAKACQEWEEMQIGKTIISPALRKDVLGAFKRVTSDERTKELLDCSQRQVWVEATYCDAATGLKVPVKGLIDIVPDKDHPVFGTFLGDLKTTKNASGRAFARDAFKYGYHIQAALYGDLYKAATGEDRFQFLHLVVESYHPYEHRMPILADAFLQAGRATYRNALALYCRCVASGRWPGYDHEEWPITKAEDYMLDLNTMAFPDVDEEDEVPAESEEVMP